MQMQTNRTFFVEKVLIHWPGHSDTSSSVSVLQMAGVASTLIVLVTVLKLGPLFQELPKVLCFHKHLETFSQSHLQLLLPEWCQLKSQNY